VNAGVAAVIGVSSLATITPALVGYGFTVAILVGLCAAPYPLYLTVRTDTLEALA
jgi:putative ABC transport system permease protein